MVHVVGRLLQLEINVRRALAGIRLAPDEIDRLVPGEREEPRGERAPRLVEAARVLPDGDEDLLHHVLGVAIAAGHLQSQGVQGTGVAGVQGLERALVPVAHERHQRGLLVAALARGVVRRTGHRWLTRCRPGPGRPRPGRARPTLAWRAAAPGDRGARRARGRHSVGPAGRTPRRRCRPAGACGGGRAGGRSGPPGAARRPGRRPSRRTRLHHVSSPATATNRSSSGPSASDVVATEREPAAVDRVDLVARRPRGTVACRSTSSRRRPSLRPSGPRGRPTRGVTGSPVGSTDASVNTTIEPRARRSPTLSAAAAPSRTDVSEHLDRLAADRRDVGLTGDEACLLLGRCRRSRRRRPASRPGRASAAPRETRDRVVRPARPPRGPPCTAAVGRSPEGGRDARRGPVPRDVRRRAGPAARQA